MRRFKFRKKINWKYILGEIFLIFVGINLAIWFNNWNSSQKINRDKKTALVRIEEEIKNNLNEVTNARATNQLFLQSFTAYQPFFSNDSDTLIATPEQFHALQNKFPEFFTVTDSVVNNGGNYFYIGSSNLHLELSELSEIAWETTRSINITNDFSYDCLYELESLYNLQRKVDAKNKLITDAVLADNMEHLIRVLNVMGQIEVQLLEDYGHVLEVLKDCR